MHDAVIDRLAQWLATERPSRRLVAMSIGIAAIALIGRQQPAGAGCNKVGRKCDKNKECCDGARCKCGKNSKCRCKSGLKECPGEKACKNLNTDLNHCGSCGSACPDFAGLPGLVFCVAGECRTCPAGADHCLSPPSTCEGRDDWFCMKRVEDGVSTCGNRPRCDEPCDADADCPLSTFFCAAGVIPAAPAAPARAAAPSCARRNQKEFP